MTESRDFKEMKNTPYESYYLRNEGSLLTLVVYAVATLVGFPLCCMTCWFSIFVCNARVSEANIYDNIKMADWEEKIKKFKE